LLQDNEERVWTADEAKTPCEAQSGSKHFPEMQKRKEKNLKLK